MRAAAFLVLVGCYAPRVPSGVACDPADPACPVGQTCQPDGTCSAMASPADAAHDAPADSAADARTIDAPPDAQAVFVYRPSVVACINPLAPDPAACAAAALPNGVRVDGDDAGRPWDAFVRVDLDDLFAGRTVTAVHLRMTANSNPGADSASSGAVFESVPFAMADLSTAEPAKANPSALAGSQGAVTQLQTIDWPLPARLATPNGSIYLEVETTNSDAVFYWNDAGTTPPQLIVDVQ